MTRFGLSPSSAETILRDVRRGAFPDRQETLEVVERDSIAESRARIDRQLTYFPHRKSQIDPGGMLFKAILGDWSAPRQFATELARAERAAEVVRDAPPPCCALRICAAHVIERRREIAANTNAVLNYAEREIDTDVLRQYRERALLQAKGSDRLAEFILMGEIRKYAQMRGVTL